MGEDRKAAQKRRLAQALRDNLRRRKAAKPVEADGQPPQAEDGRHAPAATPADMKD